jgi:hypothetical protein
MFQTSSRCSTISKYGRYFVSRMTDVPNSRKDEKRCRTIQNDKNVGTELGAVAISSVSSGWAGRLGDPRKVCSSRAAAMFAIVSHAWSSESLVICKALLCCQHPTDAGPNRIQAERLSHDSIKIARGLSQFLERVICYWAL